MDEPEIDTLSLRGRAGRSSKTIVRSLETGTAPLDESIELYQRGDRLKRHCEARLKAAQARIDQISVDADGQPVGTTSFDAG